MNLEKVYKLVQADFKQLGFELKESTREKIEFTAEIVAKDYFDDGVYVDVIVYSSGTVHIFMTFDKIDATLGVYQLINDFNDSVPFLKAYISEKKGGDYLELHATSINNDDHKVAADAVSFFLNNLLSDTTIKYLTPLTELTY